MLILPIVEINRADVKDTEMEQTINMIVDGLFSYFVTFGKSPSVCHDICTMISMQYTYTISALSLYIISTKYICTMISI